MENPQQIQNVQNSQTRSNTDSESTISLKDLVFIVINNWYWFALSLFVCLVIAGIIFKSKPKEYEYRTTIMVRDDSDRQHHYRTMDAILNNVGEDIGAHSLSDEIYLLKSSSIAKNVVTRLNLNNTCNRSGLFTKNSYYKDRPLELKVFTKNVEITDVNIVVNVTPIDMSRYGYEISTVTGGTTKKKGTA